MATLRRVALALLLAPTASCSFLPDPMDPKVAEVVDRSRTTNATYSLYSRSRLTLEGRAPVEEWGAEFHHGALHRVETPTNRMVANCTDLSGTHLFLPTGERSSEEWIAKAACGINANKPIASSEWLGRVDTPFGPADRVKLVDGDSIRTYDVADNGALVAGTISDLDGTMRVVNTAVELRPRVADMGIFAPSSLNRSAVPDRIKITMTAEPASIEVRRLASGATGT